MGFLAVWKILEGTIIEFRRKGTPVPAEVIDKLRSAKILIKILKRDPDRKEFSQKIEKRLLDVQSYLLSEGQKQFGKTYVEDLLQRLDEAGREKTERKRAKPKFIFKPPKDKRWIRVRTSADLPMEEMKGLAGKLDLFYNTQENSSLLVYGEEKKIKKFLEKMTTKYGQKKSNKFKNY